MKTLWLVVPGILLALAACDSGPDDSTGTTGPGTAGSSGASSGTGGSGGSSGSGGGAGSDGTAGTSGGGKTSESLGLTCIDGMGCTDGLVCMPLSNGSGDTCKEVARACSKPCTTDQECGAEGEALCVPDCGIEGKRCAKDGFSGKLGEACSAKKTCQEGLSCIPFLIAKDGGACEPVDDVCSRTCTDDASCSDLGPKAKCFGCGDARFCGLTG